MTPPVPTGEHAAALRRDLGPVAWCALECLLERSADGRTALASVRATAEELGVAKNTAHRAMAALVRTGLVELEQHRNRDGKFQRGRYRLHLGDLLAASSPTQPRARQRAATTVASAQLTLLPGA